MAVSKHYIEITDEIHGSLVEHRERTGVGPTRLLKYMKRCGLLPEASNLKLPTLEGWFARISQKANKRDVQAVLSAYERIQGDSHLCADTHPRQLVLLSESLRKELSVALSKRRQYSLKFAVENPECPSSLSLNTMLNLTKGCVFVLEADAIRYVQHFLKDA